MTCCHDCTIGNHPHDRFTANAPEVRAGYHRAGEDAGCPARGCQCNYVLPVRPPKPHCPTCRCATP